MNRIDIINTRAIIENVMVEFLFEPINDYTIKNIKTAIAQRIDVCDNLDFYIDATKESYDRKDSINEGYDIKVSVKICDVINDEDLTIVAQYTSENASLTDIDSLEDDKRLLAYDNAMEIV